jgi:hypothetical protein
LVDVSDPDFTVANVTHWGSEDGAVEEECHHCGVRFYLYERVTRRWVAGRTPEEARDL